MASYNVTLDFSNLLDVVDKIEQETLDKVRKGVGMAAEGIMKQWVDAVLHAPGIWSKEKNAYISSLSWRHTTYTSAVVETTLRLADEIERGRPARDLKKMLDTSMKVRKGKKGRYLIIPFRHNTPGNTAHAPAMPSSIFKQAGQMEKSLITGHSKRESATGAYSIKTKQKYLVRQREYSWGGRLPAGLAPKMKSHHATDIYANMVRMNTSSGKQKSSEYLTFRIMSENQTGKWIVPAKPGLWIARRIAEGVNKKVEEAMKASS